jgi:PAS domain S-box-containing protein
MAVSGDRSTPRVLYVDPDDERASEGIRALEQGALRVELVTDVERARERALEESLDCIVVEADLGGESGLEFVREVTGRDGHPPVVMFTDDGDEHLASDAITAGVADYVPREPVGKQRLALRDAVERVISETDPKFPEVSEQLKDQAMDEAPVGITIADARRLDYPLIYANAAFEKLTGYTEAEALARNCDFLQGDDSDPNAIAEMSRALSRDEPVSVEIQNYDKHGERFWNRVDIAPILDEDGEVTHYVGFQLDVTERVEAEQEARRQAEKARAERETVEALLARIDGLVTDVTSGLLGAEDRGGVERAVCERLVETDEYALAWVGDPEPASNTVEPTTWVGSDHPDGFSVALDGTGPVARAIATGEMQVVDEEADEGADVLDGYADYVGGPVSAVAALPLQYGDVGYGVLVVALEAGATLSEPERRVLSAVGQSTAMALHDLTSQRLLTSDEVIELEFALDSGGGADAAPFFVDLSRRLDATFTHVGTVARDDGPTTLFFETDADPEAVDAALADGSEAVRVTTVTAEAGRSVLEFTVESSPLVDLLLDRGGRITDMRATGGLGEVTVEIPPEAQPRAVVGAVEDRFSGADLRAYREHERPADTRQDVRARIDDRLTDRQETALQTAIVGGFFEWPRDSTGEDLAETMDIGRSTFHQHLRAAQRKVFEELYG